MAAPLRHLLAHILKWVYDIWYKRQWFSNNMVLSVVKDVPRQWFLASLPSSVGFMWCKRLVSYVTGVYLYCPYSPVHNCGPQSTNVDQSPQLWTSVL